MTCECDLMNMVVNVSLEGRFFCSSLCFNEHLYHLELRGEVCRFENQVSAHRNCFGCIFYDFLIKRLGSHKFGVLADSKGWLIDELIQYLKCLIYL